MKPYISLAIGLSLSLPLYAAANPEVKPTLGEAPVCASTDPSCIVLTENQSVELNDLGAIDFVGVTEDSRCPSDAVCIWAGRVAVVLKRQLGDTNEKFELGLGGNLLSTWKDAASGSSLLLQQVWPEKSVGSSNTEPYQIKLKIVPASASPVQGESAVQQNLDSN